MYEILHSDINSSFKERLESQKLLKSLFDHPNYKLNELEEMTPENVPLVNACAMNTVIAPGEDYYYCVEITENNSLLL